MKKLLLVLTVPLYLLVLVSCNQTGEKKGEDSDVIKKQASADSTECPFYVPDSLLNIEFCHNEPGAGNLIISEAAATPMIKHFSDVFKKAGANPNLKTDYWVDKCGIYALRDFFGKHDGYDGAWIIFGVDSATDLSTIYFVPTLKPNPGAPHVSDWTPGAQISVPAGCSSAAYFRDKASAHSKIVNFRSTFRGESPATGAVVHDSLSKKVWIHSCVFKSLAALIDRFASSSPALDGVSILSAAYSSIATTSPPKGQIYSNQSTVILVPTYPCTVHGNQQIHEPAWEINDKLFDKYVVKAGIAYNHGELCPNACNTASED